MAQVVEIGQAPKSRPKGHGPRLQSIESPLSPCSSYSTTATANAKSNGGSISPPSSYGFHNANSSQEDVSNFSDDSDHEQECQIYVATPVKIKNVQPDLVEDLRDKEYPQLRGRVYLDHGGATISAKSLIEKFAEDMIGNLYGNPHSESTPSALSGQRVDAIREKALRFFNADPADFDLIFVANATAAIKLATECVRDYAAKTNTPLWYGYHKDAHTSLVGVREFARMHRCFTSDEEVEIWINSGGLGGPRARELGLFGFPGQSNMTGRRLPLHWPGRIRRGFHKATTYTLLDAAALASTAPLDLADPATAPDFVALSFYKIFGFPNIGALIVRKEAAHVLAHRNYFAGGTVEMVISINDTWHAKKDILHERLEDGTLPFHSIFALEHAIDTHRRLYGPNPMKFISNHTSQLSKRLFHGLNSMKHFNGTPVIKIYKDPNSVYGDPTLQGATVAFNVMRADGSFVGFQDVEKAADERQIYVRSGSLCNPGGVATYLEWTPPEMRAAYHAGHRCSHPMQQVQDKVTGVVRVSLGAMTTYADVRALLRFLREVYVNSSISSDSLYAMPSLSSCREEAILSQSSHSSPRQVAQCGHSTHSGSKSLSSASSVYTTGTCTIQAGSASVAARWNPADMQQLRPRPWQDQIRKESAQRANLDASSLHSKATTKSRKFGRSMASILKSKNHVQQDSRYEVAC